MTRKLVWLILLLGLAVANVSAQNDPFIVGLVMAGQPNDDGWHESHYTAACTLFERIPNLALLFYASGASAEQLEAPAFSSSYCRARLESTPGAVDADIPVLSPILANMITQGARVIFVTDAALEEQVGNAAAAMQGVLDARAARAEEAAANERAEQAQADADQATAAGDTAAANRANDARTTALGEAVEAGRRAVAADQEATDSDPGVAEAVRQLGEQFEPVVFIVINGDSVLTGQAPPTVGNLAAQMEWVQIISGCAAALTTQTGEIGYLGDSPNPQSLRLASSAYLGARYCLSSYRTSDFDPAETRLVLNVQWLNPTPTQTIPAGDGLLALVESDSDVLISEAIAGDTLSVLETLPTEETPLFLIAYQATDHLHETEPELSATAEVNAVDHGEAQNRCQISEACLGTVEYHWEDDYARIVQAVIDGTWTQQWEWVSPNWETILQGQHTVVSFVPGAALHAEARVQLQRFVDALAEYAQSEFAPDGFALWQGPLMLQDGTEIAGANTQVGYMDVWYLQGLIAGICLGDSIDDPACQTFIQR